MSTTVPKFETIDIVLYPNGVAEIAHNRPKRYNALSPQSYRVKIFASCLDIKKV
jgi:peroxisomal 3,2-trans-enoyl-CoA isomerase